MGFEGLGEWIKNTIDQFADYIKPWVVVNHYEEAVILRFGKYHRSLKPGLYLKFPVAEYHLTAHVKEETLECKPLTITTLDGETVVISGVVTYDVSDIKKYLVENNDSLSNMKDTMRAEMSNHLEDINWENIKKKTTKNGVKRAVATKFLDYGVTVKDFNFSDKCKISAYKLFSDVEKSSLML